MTMTQRSAVGIWTVALVLAGVNAWIRATQARSLRDAIVVMVSVLVALVALLAIQDAGRR